MASEEPATKDDTASPPPAPDSKDTPSADNSTAPSNSSSSSSPPPKDTPPSSTQPAPSPPTEKQSPPPPSPSPPPPSPPPNQQQQQQQPKDSSPPPPSPPPPSPPSSDSPPQKDPPPPSPPPPTNGTTSTPATPETPPPAPPTPPGPVTPPPGPTTPPHETAGGTPPAPLGPSSAPNSSALSSPSDSLATSTLPPPSPPSETEGNTPLVVGVIAAAAVAIALAIIWLVCLKRRKRKQQYDQYYNRATSQYNQQNMDHVVKFPSLSRPPGTPTGAAAAGVGGGWGTNSDDSNYSGQHNQQQTMQNPSPLGNIGGYASQSQFSYQELATATSGFSQENLLGQGGFGYVHKGVLANGTVVAVKSLKSGSGQGEREFQAEVEIISRVHHRHLVSLVGYCIAESQRMLVYEFVPNKTLEHHLHGKDVPVMDWTSRMRIALGSAKGLAYLHEDCHPRIIHRDIKAANILLDENYEAMVADFGLAKLSSDNFTHVSTRVMGTFGYLAPEYASSGKLSDKSDVFSFGVMLLELVTGQKPVDPTGQMEDSLVDWARPLMTKALEDGNYDEIADPRMEGNFDPSEMAHMIACASASVRHSAKRRPRMSQIVRSLEGDLAIDDMNEGVKHKLSNTTSGVSSTSVQESLYDTGAYNADMMKFRKMILNPQEATTDDFSPKSEHAFDPNSPLSGEYMHKK